MIDLSISTLESSHLLPITALNDSGCAASIIKTSVFEKLISETKTEITPHPNTFIVSVTGQETPVLGSAQILLTFTGTNKVTKKFPLKVYIHNDVGYDFLLGRDFTGSNAKAFETPTTLFLSDENEPPKDMTYWLSNLHLCSHIPLQKDNEQSPQLQLFTNKEMTLLPMSLTNITCSLRNMPLIIPSTDKEIPFTISHIISPLTTLKDTLFSFTNITHVNIPIFNNSSEDYDIPFDYPIASIHLLSSADEIIPISSTNLTTTDFIQTEKLYTNSSSLQNTISEDDSLTEQEKDTAFYQYTKNGSYAIPMSTFIDNTPSITEMEYKQIENKELSIKEFLNQFNIQHLPPNYRNQAKNMLLANKQVFSSHDLDLGRANDIEMDITIDETKPRIQKFIPIPHNVRHQVRQILDQMIEFNIIRECHEPSLFCSNLLVAKKKDKSQIRILLDGRLLNNATIRLPTNLVTQMEVFSHLSGKKFVSTIDVSHAFFQVPLSEKAQPYTAFFSEEHGKRYCFNRAPQGLKNSPLHLKLLMDKLLGDMALTVIHYVDDILIATDKNLEHHLRTISEVLRRLHKGGLKIKPAKIFINTDEIEFLGVIYRKGTLHVPAARVKAFQEFPKPKTPKQVKSFVCAMSYYRKFIPRFSEMSHPLTELTQLHHKQFKWLPIHDKSFQDMIKAIENFTSLTLPDPSKPFYVQTDASDYCGAGRIFQKDENDQELLLACVSRTFTKAEQKYGVFRKETLALLYTLKSMDFYLRFANKVIILIDAKAILYLRMCKDSAGILLRFSLEISKYDAEIHHVQGISNEISDALSRNNIHISDIIQEKKEANILSEKQTEHILKRLTIPNGKQFSIEEVKWLLEADSLTSPFYKKIPPSKAKIGKRSMKSFPKTLGPRKVKLPQESRWRQLGVILPTNPSKPTLKYEDFKSITKLLLSKDITPALLIQAQRDDQFLSKIINTKPLSRQFIMVDGILFKKQHQGLRLALPSSFLDAIINTKHFSIFGLHFSRTRISQDILSKYYVQISILNDKLFNLTKSCIICQFNSNTLQQHKLQVTNFIHAPRASWACDIIPSLPLSKNNNTAILLAIDMFTGYIQLQPLKTRTAEDLIPAFLNAIIRPFGSPKFIRCDSESALFSGKEFYNFLAPLGIDFLTCSIGAPWSNGAAERAVQTVKHGLRKFVQQEKIYTDWDIHLHHFSAAHNSSCTTYGYTPEELHFGFTNPSHNDLFQSWPDVSNPENYMQKIVPIAEKHRQKARQNQIKNAKRLLTFRNKNKVQKSFSPGQVVLQRQLQLASGPGKALQPKYTGPYVINSIDKDASSCLIEHLHTGHETNSHFSNIKLLDYCPSSNRAQTDIDNELLKFLPEKNSKTRYYDIKASPNDFHFQNDTDLDNYNSTLQTNEHIINDPIKEHLPPPPQVFNFSLEINDEFETETEKEEKDKKNEQTDDETNIGRNKHTKKNSQMKRKIEKDAITINDLPPPCVLPDTVNPNLPSGINSIDPLVPDIHANPSIKKPPDPNQQPFQRITRSMTKLGTSISNITTKKFVDIQVENFSSRPLSSDNIVKMVKTIFSDATNIEAIKRLTSSTSA